jgi:tetratricopeptide (TPR) repeat protein
MSSSKLDPRTDAARRSTEVDDPIDSIVAQCLESTGGELEAALDSACSAHPAHASEIRRRITALRDMGFLDARVAVNPGKTVSEQAGGPGDDPRNEPFPERLGDFRLVRRLGGGGMGVVFLARQESLGRDVALKIIRLEHLFFPRARERFRRETEAVARLQHPGIVPIFTVGEEHAIPFFAMELVAGCTLAEVIRDLQGRAPESLQAGDMLAAMQRCAPPAPEPASSVPPALFEGSWVHACLRAAIQTAEALQHAHGRGVLHRDIKPSNIAVTFDGRAMLLDFGLASLEEEARVTAQGSAIGSLLYMSPEQIRGETASIGATSDVYSLGVTLYELLTLQAPFSESNPIDTRRAIVEGRADSIRARNRAVPKDLETVCFKALEREQARRYASAEAFARDLRNVLELRPIEARPPGAWLRAQRLVQRKPAASAAVALGLLLVVGAPSALLVQQKVHNHSLQIERDIAVAAKKDADTQRTAAVTAEHETSLQRDRAKLEARESDEVAQFMVDLFGAADPARSLGRERTARELLDLGLERVRRELGDQPELQARLLQRMADTYAGLGSYQRALELTEEALAMRRKSSGGESLAVAQSLHSLALVQRALGDGHAVENGSKALEMRATLGAEPDAQLAQYMVALGNALSGARRFAEAADVFARALALQERLPGDQRVLRELILTDEASALLDAQQFDRAAETARAAIAVQRELHDGPHPAQVANFNTLALALKSQKRFDDAARVYDDLLELGAALWSDNNDHYAVLVMNKASLLDERGDSAGSRELYEQALDIYDRTVAPNFPQRVACLTNLAGVCLRSGDFARARDLYAEALPLVRAQHGDAGARTAQVLNRLGLAHEGLKDFEAAEKCLREALEAAQHAEHPDPADIAAEQTALARVSAERDASREKSTQR